MPTTVTGLLIFVALLAPGFAFLVVVERGPRANVERSALRETATIVLASLGCDAVAVAPFAIVRSVLPKQTVDPAALIRSGKSYYAAHLALTTTWALILFATAVLAAVVLAGVLNRPVVLAALKAAKPVRWLLPPSGSRMESTWWKLLTEQNPAAYRLVTVHLDDGTVIQGWLLSSSSAANETTDRELALSAPLSITKKDGAVTEEAYGAVAVHASRIQFMYVDYRMNGPIQA